MMRNSRELPVGIQDFEDLRTTGHLYVDKTACIYKPQASPAFSAARAVSVKAFSLTSGRFIKLWTAIFVIRKKNRPHALEYL